MEIGAAYRLGFTIAKISWHFGNSQERKNLISQAELFSSRIGFPKKKLKKALSKLKENPTGLRKRWSDQKSVRKSAANVARRKNESYLRFTAKISPKRDPNHGCGQGARPTQQGK